MATHVPLPPGLPPQLKPGARFFSGQQEALLCHLPACRALARSLRTAYGPLGRPKLLLTRLGQPRCTAHAGAILRELALENPAARLLGEAGRAQAEEPGDGAAAVLLLAGALLDHAERLLRAGLPAPALRDGYRAAGKEAGRLLPGLACGSLAQPRDPERAAWALRAAVGSQLHGHQDFLAGLVARACVAARGPEGAFEPGNVLLCRVPGGGVPDSRLLEGVVLRTEPASRACHAAEARVAVYSCPFGPARPATQATALFRGAPELWGHGGAEEALLGQRVRAIAAAGAGVVVAGGPVDPLALQYADQLGLMVVRVGSRRELGQLSRAVGAVPLGSLVPPPPGAMGRCGHVALSEIGGTAVVVFRQAGGCCPVATLLLRGATDPLLRSLEEAVMDGLKTYKALLSDPRLVPGAGATEMALAVRLATLGTALPGPEQHGVLAFAEALKTLPGALAENAGLPVPETLAALESRHRRGAATAGVGLGEGGPPILDAAREGVLDSLLVKERVLRLATHTATTLLGVGDILVAKKSGGPRIRGENPNWDLEPDALE